MVTLLDKFGFATLNLDDQQNPMIIIKSPGAQFNVFAEIKRFCETTKVDMKRLIIDLDFSLLD